MTQSASRDIAFIDVTPTISTSAYADNDLIGGKLTLANAVRVPGGGGILESLVLADEDDEGAACEVVFFSADPSSTTFTDNAAEAIADADLIKIIHVAEIAAADYVDFAGGKVAIKNNIGAAFVVPDGERDIYACIVSAGTPTYTATDDLKLRVGIVRD